MYKAGLRCDVPCVAWPVDLARTGAESPSYYTTKQGRAGAGHLLIDFRLHGKHWVLGSVHGTGTPKRRGFDVFGYIARLAGSGVAFSPKKQGGTSGLDDCFDGFIDATFGQRDRARGQFVRSASPNDRPSQPRASDRSFARRPADRAATCALSHATRDEYRWDGGGQSS